MNQSSESPLVAESSGGGGVQALQVPAGDEGTAPVQEDLAVPFWRQESAVDADVGRATCVPGLVQDHVQFLSAYQSGSVMFCKKAKGKDS